MEPFCGGLAVALGLAPQRALLNDINPPLINFYRWLKRGLLVNIPMENSEDLYYAHRTRFNELLRMNGGAKSSEAAALFYYLNRTGYNGLCRFNQKGGFNVPFGKYGRINYARDFFEYRSVFRRWQFLSKDFELLQVEPDDFIYADPPYDVEFTQYSKTGFSWEDQVRTAEWVSSHKGPAVLVNQATSRIVDLFKDCGFEMKLLDAPRRISCTGDREPVKEVIATKNL